MTQLVSAFGHMPRPLLWTTLGHAIVGLACLLVLWVPAAPVMGVHPALKPLKFAVSIALFLATMGLVLLVTSLTPTLRTALAWLFSATMVVEMLLIVMQAVRGTTSHFNQNGPLSNAAWSLMVLAIVVATLGMVSVAVLASARPLLTEQGRELPPLMVFACRAGLWLLLLAPISGFAMGGRLQHSVGGNDGGPGLPFVNWSVLHGDLRVAHFFALHAVQVLPCIAWALLRSSLGTWARWGLLSTAVGASVALCLGTLAQALAGRPCFATSENLAASEARQPSLEPGRPR
jgi:hypothetical protein